MSATAARLADYGRWHHLQVATRDIDPTYPVLRHLTHTLGLDRDAAAWLVILHVTYYHLGSALAAFAATGKPAAPSRALLRLGSGTERRAHRDPRKLDRHWAALLDVFDRHGGPAGWIDAGGTDWNRLNTHLGDVHGNGRWAAYKLAELAQKVLDVPTVVADAGHANSSGPRQGLALLHPIPAGNTPAVIARLDALTARLAADLGEPDIGQVETSLCDFHALHSGRYYLGHDIDAMQHQLNQQRSELTPTAYAARAATLPHRYLGEHGGWVGPDTTRKVTYRRHGVIVER